MYVQKIRDKLSRICLENWPLPTNAFKENRRSSRTRRDCTPRTLLKMKNLMIQCSLVTVFTGSYLWYFYAVEIVFFNLPVINILFQHILAVLLQHQVYECLEMPENLDKNSVVFLLLHCFAFPGAKLLHYERIITETQNGGGCNNLPRLSGPTILF